eukprot:Pompholyxophrys_punicea_v1_NODE_1277_length_820_cov_1.690196.p2 type:complete len:104 gc:universal NODE_1277_length_820_cov_1.690196:167-478(+)
MTNTLFLPGYFWTLPESNNDFKQLKKVKRSKVPWVWKFSIIPLTPMKVKIERRLPRRKRVDTTGFEPRKNQPRFRSILRLSVLISSKKTNWSNKGQIVLISST